MAKLTIAAMILLLAAAIRLTEAQSIPSCASKLIPCADYLNSNSTPAPSCCNAVKDAVTNDVVCLCGLYNDPSVLKSFNITLAAALQLARNCGVNADFTVCTKAPPPAASVPPPPGQPGAADKMVWTGLTSLLLSLAFAVLYYDDIYIGVI